MSFDLRSALRRLRPDRRSDRLVRRPDADLPFADDATVVGPPLVLDTCVYIDVLQGRSPPTVDTLVTVRVCHHSAVCLAELCHAFSRLDPAHPEKSRTLARIAQTVETIRPHRLSAPDAEVWGTAGIVAGLLFRLGGYRAGEERRCLDDALLHLQARKLGAAVLTRNVRDFDLLGQLLPDGRVLFYRTA